MMKKRTMIGYILHQIEELCWKNPLPGKQHTNTYGLMIHCVYIIMMRKENDHTVSVMYVDIVHDHSAHYSRLSSALGEEDVVREDDLQVLAEEGAGGATSASGQSKSLKGEEPPSIEDALVPFYAKTHISEVSKLLVINLFFFLSSFSPDWTSSSIYCCLFTSSLYSFTASGHSFPWPDEIGF